MKSRNEQKLIDQWIRNYGSLSTDDLKQIYADDFEGKGTPSREEDKARMKAIETLLL